MYQKTLIKGIIFALGACFVWGLIFIVPYYMTDFSPLEVVIGRYLFYGSISAFMFAKAKFQKKCSYSKSILFKALYFSLIATIGYYTFLVLAIRYSSPAICALIIGISPISIAFYGNWKQKETSFKSLIVPSILVLAGLIIINAEAFTEVSNPFYYTLGLFFSFGALASWSWYVVANSSFLKKHTAVSPSDWATLIGVSSLFWAFIMMLILTPFSKSPFELTKYLSYEFLVGSALMGLVCSWVGSFLWNRASLYLPVSLAGQLTIFETIFGVLFFYILTKSVPSTVETLGIVVLISAIVYGIRKFARRKSFTDQISPH